MSLLVRDNRIIVPALRDAAPTTGAITNMHITLGGVKFTEVIDVGTFTEIIGFVNCTTFTSGTLDVGFQVSPDGKNFIDASDNFAQVTAKGLQLKRLTANFGKYIRLKLTGSATPDVIVSIYLACKG